jgi:hypothetical protein
MKSLLAISIALFATSGAAFAQTADQTWDQSATGGQGGMNTPERFPIERPQYVMPPDVTTGMGPGVIVAPGPMWEGPMPQGPVWEGPIHCPADGESSQGNVGPGTGC